MTVDTDDPNREKELTREEAKKMREYYLALADKNAKHSETDSDEIDSADSTMATLILPGG